MKRDDGVKAIYCIRTDRVHLLFDFRWQIYFGISQKNALQIMQSPTIDLAGLTSSIAIYSSNSIIHLVSFIHIYSSYFSLVSIKKEINIESD